MKVAGTNRYNHGIAVSVSVSLLLASLYTDDNEERSDLLSEARNNLCDLSVSIVDSTLDVEIGFGILACMEGDIKSCFLVANKIKKDISEVTSFYTALNMAKLYSFCGMSSSYEKAVSQARNICGQTDDDVLMLSLVKLLESSSKVIKQRYENGEKLISKAFAHRQKNKANLAISEAYQAFFMVPFSVKSCLLILELTALSTPSLLSTEKVLAIIESCWWVCSHNIRSSSDEKNRAKRLFNIASAKVLNAA